MRYTASRKALFIGVLIFIVLITILVFFIDWQTVFDQLSHANGYYLVLACALLIVGYVLYAARWRILLSKKRNLKPIFHAANISSMMSSLSVHSPLSPLGIHVTWCISGLNDRSPQPGRLQPEHVNLVFVNHEYH